MLALKSFLRLILKDRNAQFGVITALMLFPMLGTVGAAVDLAYALKVKSDLAVAADSVLLNGVSAPNITNMYGTTSPNSFLINVLRVRIERGFRRQVPAILQKNVAVTVEPRLAADTGQISVQLHYRVTVPTTFLRLVGVPMIVFSTSASSVASMAQYADVHVMIDNSPSMVVGADNTERSRLFQMVVDFNTLNKRNKVGCFFACHDLETNLSAKDDYYQIARAAGIRLRLDVVKDAVVSLLNDLSRVNPTSSQLRYSIYSFGDVVAFSPPVVATLVSQNRSVQTVSQTVQNLGPAGVPAGSVQGYNATNMKQAFAELDLLIPPSGTGASPDVPMQTLVIITDGVTNSTYKTNCPISGTTYCIRPIPLSGCKALKARGVKIAVLDVGYPVVSGSSHYDRWIGPYESTFPKGLKDCASPGLYQIVAENQNISQLLQGLFNRTVTQPRLTN